MKLTAPTCLLSVASHLLAAAGIPVQELVERPEKLSQFAARYTSPTPLYASNETLTALTTLVRILNTQADPDPDLIKSLVSFDATYVSLNQDNPSLHRIMPWAGTRARVGPQAFVDTMTRVGLWWTRGPFSLDALFTDGRGNLTAWGTFEVTSNTMQRTVTTPWAVRAVVNGDGLISYYEFMEDTFATSSTFWAGGAKEYCANPFGGCEWY